MIAKALLAFAAFAVLSATPASGAPCKDTMGKVSKCPPVVKGINVSSGSVLIIKDAKGRCRLASGPRKGQLTACP